MEPSKLTQPLVILARHGQTDYNSKAAGSAERLRGWKDIPLNDAGRQEAKRLAAELSSYPITTVISSDLSRAFDTAKAVAKPHNLPVIPATALRPWNLGKFQGQPVKGIEAQLNSYIANPAENVPQGESFDAFKQRYLELLQMVLDNTKSSGQVMALVSHTRNAQLTKAWLAAGGDRSFDISNRVMTDYAHQPHTGDYLLVLPDGNSGWKAHSVVNSEPRSYEEYNHNRVQTEGEL